MNASQIEKRLLDFTRQYLNDGDQFVDPVIRLMYGAFSKELEKAYDFHQGAEERILNRLNEQLFNVNLHDNDIQYSVAKAMPKSANFEMSNDVQFSLEIPYDRQNRNIDFSPIVSSSLQAALPRYIIGIEGISKHYFVQKNDGYKIELQQESGAPPDYINEIVIGIEYHKTNTKLDNSYLYFNFEESVDRLAKDLILNSLSTCQASVFGESIVSKQGFEELSMVKKNLFTQLERNMITTANYLFGSSFLHLTVSDQLEFEIENILKGRKQAKPFTDYDAILDTGLSSILRKDELMLKGEIMWLSLKFGSPIESKYFTNGECKIELNCFPVANRSVQQKDDADTYFSEGALNIVKIESDKKILGIKKVTEVISGKEVVYKPLKSLMVEEEEELYFSTKRSGMSNRDDLNIWRQFVSIINLYRSQNKVKEFIDICGDNLSLQEVYALFKDKIDEIDAKKNLKDIEDRLYLIFKGNSGERNRLQIDYWTLDTDVKLVDQNYPNSLSLSKKLPGLEAKSCQILKKPALGSSEIDQKNVFERFRRLATTREGIRTKSDIINWVKEILGEKVSLQVKKGVFVDARPGFDVSRTIDVRILNPQIVNMDPDQLKDYLEKELNAKSSLFIPIKVYLN